MTANLMPIEYIDDWEKRIARQDAFWTREIIDRPVTCITIPKKDAAIPYPAKKDWKGWRERWMDSEFIAEWNLAKVAHTEYLGDALPATHPNLGPDIFATLFGAELEFSDRTSWSTPILDSLDNMDALQYQEGNVYWKKIMEITDALLAVGRGKFYTGITDLHVGGDCIAAFRGPENLSIDLIEQPDDVKRLLDRVTQACFHVTNYCHEYLRAYGQATTTWLNIVSSRKWYVPSNDYSCMISPDMFNDVFLPGIAAECRNLEASIYHLDGPNALQHLDSLLSIPELNAIQWVWGAGHGRASDWLDIFKRCQAANKGVWLPINVNELDLIMENLRPEGAYLRIGGIETKEHAEAVLKKVTSWR